ncbi:hypothetical protein L1887_00835 [Cichorium endivia]|nr:hypothetical protein L1887_00835 [Cichorium endivia]
MCVRVHIFNENRTRKATCNLDFSKRRLPTGTLKPAIHSSSSIPATADSSESASASTYASESAYATRDTVSLYVELYYVLSPLNSFMIHGVLVKHSFMIRGVLLKHSFMIERFYLLKPHILAQFQKIPANKRKQIRSEAAD